MASVCAPAGTPATQRPGWQTFRATDFTAYSRNGWSADTGATLEEARENLIDAVHCIQEPVDLARVPKSKVIVQEIEV